jgi:hypothetical protein
MQKKQEKRLAWTTPELKRIHAGSAEAIDNQGPDDTGGSGSTDKS